MPNQMAKLQVAPPNASGRGIKELSGQPVRGANGEQVGTLKDFIVDTKTGRVVLAVVASSHEPGATNAALRILPISGIEQKSGSAGFTTPLEKSEWSKLPAIDAKDFQTGIINLTVDQRRQLSGSNRQRAEELEASVDSATESERARSNYRPRLMGAAKIAGRSVRAGGQDAGQITNVMIQLDRGMAMVVLNAKADFAGMERTFLVPLDRLQIVQGQTDPVTTDFTRAEFRQVGSQKGNVAKTGSKTDEKQPAPTGRTEATTRTDLQSEIRAVREVWEVHPELAKLNLSVTAENGKLMLRGKAPNTELSDRAKATAAMATRGVEVVSQITVESGSKNRE